MYKKSLSLCGVLCLVVVLGGCNKKEDITVKTEPAATVQEQDVKENIEKLPQLDRFEGRATTPVSEPEQVEIPVPGEGTVVPLGGDRTPDSLPSTPGGAVDPGVAAEAKACTDGGGLFNSGLRKCFKDANEEKDETEGTKKTTQEEILDTDDADTVKRKECINDGRIYNSQRKECYEKNESGT